MISIFHFCQNILLKLQAIFQRRKNKPLLGTVWKPICAKVWAGCSKLHLQASLQMPAKETQDVDFDPNTLYRLDLTILELISPFPWQLKSDDSSTNGSSFWILEVQIQYRISLKFIRTLLVHPITHFVIFFHFFSSHNDKEFFFNYLWTWRQVRSWPYF